MDKKRITVCAVKYRNWRSVQQRFADLQAKLQRLVMEFGMPVNVTVRLTAAVMNPSLFWIWQQVMAIE